MDSYPAYDLTIPQRLLKKRKEKQEKSPRTRISYALLIHSNTPGNNLKKPVNRF